MSVLVVTGTDTGVGKTVVTAAIAALALAAGRSVAVVKPAQTGIADGQPSDLQVVRALAGDVAAVELGRYPAPLAPNTAARLAGLAAVRPADVARRARELADERDLVLIEGAGGLLVRLDDAGGTLLDVAAELDAPVLVATRAGLGTLNATELTVRHAATRGVRCLGLVIGAWPAEPDLAARCNLLDLPEVTGVPLLGAMPERAGALRREAFAALARDGLAPPLGGVFDADAFRRRHPPELAAAELAAAGGQPARAAATTASAI